MKYSLLVGKNYQEMSLVPEIVPCTVFPVLSKSGLKERNVGVVQYRLNYGDNEIVMVFLTGPDCSACYVRNKRGDWEVSLPAPYKGKRFHPIHRIIWKVHTAFSQHHPWPWSPKETQTVVDYFFGTKPEDTHKPYFD